VAGLDHPGLLEYFPVFQRYSEKMKIVITRFEMSVYHNEQQEKCQLAFSREILFLTTENYLFKPISF
jgi:hypothetical protein